MKAARQPAPKAFRSRQAFRSWLGRHHASKRELVIRLYKKHAAHRGLTYRDALDEALCHGWIDGVIRSLDADSYAIRFTPRKPKSKWSDVNIRHAERLIAAGEMTAAGHAAFARRHEGAGRRYSFESPPARLSPALRKRFQADPVAWRDFQGRPPGYRRTVTFWVMEAKREATRERRLAELIEACRKHLPVRVMAG